MFCQECGAQLNADEKFCTNCGSRASVDTTASPRYPTTSHAKASPQPVSTPTFEAARQPTTASASQPSVARQPAYPSTATAPAFKSSVLLWGSLAILVVIVVGGVILYFHRSSPAISNPRIVESIKARLFDDVNLRKCTINVTAQNGIVTLVGLVNTSSDKTTAVQIAHQQRGVVEVIDQLVLSVDISSAETQNPATGAIQNNPSKNPALSDRTDDAGPITVTVPADQAWTATGIFLHAGAVVAISASGNVLMGGGWPPMPPTGRPPNCGGKGGFPAGELPCWSLIGRIGEQGAMFYVGSKIAFRAPTSGQLMLGVNDDILGDNSGTWTATVTVGPGSGSSLGATSSSSTTPSTEASGVPAAVQALVQKGETSVQLPPGRFYLYGMATGGAAPSTPFAIGQYAEAIDAAGQLAAALAYGTNNQNSYTTSTGYHDIGGVSISGSWDSFDAFYGSNSKSGAAAASVTVTVRENSLVVVIGLAAGQQDIQLQGNPGLQIDSGPSPTGYTVIGHAYMKPGQYTIIERSTVLADGQEPDHMADLIGVFVFGSKD